MGTVNCAAVNLSRLVNVLELDRGALRPQALADKFAGDHGAGILDEHGQDFDGLVGNAQP
jgi:hypothetical protein